MAPSTFDKEMILREIGVAAYKTRSDGSFVQPDDALAVFLLGHDAKGEQLASHNIEEFYVYPILRQRFLAELEENPDKPATALLYFEINGSKTWCRCSSIWRANENCCEGVLSLIPEKESHFPNLLLETKNWAHAIMNHAGEILYSSKFHRTLLRYPQQRVLTEEEERQLRYPWYDEENRKQFLSQFGETTSPKESMTLVFRGYGKRRVVAELHAQSFGAESERVIELIWRNVTKKKLYEEASLEIQNLREGMMRRKAEDRIPFEQAFSNLIAGKCLFKTAAFYRYHQDDENEERGCYILRAVSATHPEECAVRFIHSSRPEYDRPLSQTERFLNEAQQKALVQAHQSEFEKRGLWGPYEETSREVLEFLIPVNVTQEGEEVPFGCIWVPLWIAPGEESNFFAWIRAVARQLGAWLHTAEEENAQQTSRDFLDEELSLLLSGKSDPDTFYERFLKRLIEVVHAEAGSIFKVLEQPGGEGVLRFVSSSGEMFDARQGEPKLIPRSLWTGIEYKLGQGLTGTMALRKRAVSLLEVSQVRRKLSLGEASYIEEFQEKKNKSWLGCPICRYEPSPNSPQKLVGYLRLVNRRVHQGTAGFSQGDVVLVERLAQVAGQVSYLQSLYQSHQNAVVRSVASSLHELRSPLVCIRSNADYLRGKLDKSLNFGDINLANIVADAELFLALLDTIALAEQEDRKPNLTQPIDLFREVIAPLKYNLTSLVGERELHISSKGLMDLPLLRVDGDMMRQVFSNLILNAIRYSVKKVDLIPITIGWKRDSKGDFLITFEDLGIGVEPEHRKDIFQMGFRTPQARGRYPSGSGIGLSVSRRILKLHGGDLVLLRPKQPTIFALSLPSSCQDPRSVR